MIKLLVEGKQVGEVSYMVADLDVLLYILDDEMLLRSRLQELNPKTQKKEYYLSLSRNLTAAAKRNGKRWRWGVILNGDKLSDRYSITPVSYSGIQMSYSDLRVKYITAYDNGTYALNLKLRSDLGELSQTSMSFAANNLFLTTLTIHGTNGKWIEKEVEFEVFVSIDNYIDISFAQTGIEVGAITVTKKASF